MRPLRIDKLKQMLCKVVRCRKMRHQMRALVQLAMRSTVSEISQCRTRNCVLKELEQREVLFVEQMEELLEVAAAAGWMSR